VIARHDQRAEAETPAAFHDLRATIDEHDFLGRVASRRGVLSVLRSCRLPCRRVVDAMIKILIRLRAPHRPALSLCRDKCKPPRSKTTFSTFFASNVPRSLPTVPPTRDSLPLFFPPNLSASCRGQRLARIVIDHLRVNMLPEKWTRGAAVPPCRSLFSGSLVNALSGCFSIRRHNLLNRLAFLAANLLARVAHAFALVRLRRIISRISAATWPTNFLSIP
jgi:hypothetical protein